MYEVKYESRIPDVVFSVALGTSPTNATWSFADDLGFFHDAGSYKQKTNFTTANKIQQFDILSTVPHQGFKVPQTFTASITGTSTTQLMSLTTSNTVSTEWFFNTSNFNTITPSNGDSIRLISNLSTATKDVDTTSTAFNLKKIDFPSDISCNYNQAGSIQYAGSVPLYISGNLKTGDTFTISRSKHTPIDTVATIKYDTTGMFGDFGTEPGEEWTLTYKHNNVNPDPTPTTRTVTYTSSDAHISWLNATTTNGTKETNTIHFSQGYCVDADFNIDITYHDGTSKRFPYQLPSTNKGITYSDQKLTVPDLTNATTVNIPSQSKLIQGELTLNLENCDITVPQPITDSSGKVHYYIDTNNRNITIKAHPGYVFTNDGNFKYIKYGSVYTSTVTIPASNSDTIAITIPDNFNPLYPVTVTFGATQPDVVEDTGGFVNFYKADYPLLVSFSNEWINTVSGNGAINVYDVSNYVSNLIMVPLEIPATLINAKSSIVAGNQAYKTEMPTIDAHNYIYDLGSIDTPEIYKNGFDYYQVKTRLVLPFTDTVDLDPKHVINKKITIKYDVNFQNGDTTVIIANDNGVFFTKPFNLAKEIPFVTASTNKSQYAVINRLQDRFNNGVHQAYMLIEQPTPVLNNDYYNTIERGQLKAYTGNVKAELLTNMNVPNSDLPTLQNLLRKGVKIK